MVGQATEAARINSNHPAASRRPPPRKDTKLKPETCRERSQSDSAPLRHPHHIAQPYSLVVRSGKHTDLQVDDGVRGEGPGLTIAPEMIDGNLARTTRSPPNRQVDGADGSRGDGRRGAGHEATERGVRGSHVVRECVEPD